MNKRYIFIAGIFSSISTVGNADTLLDPVVVTARRMPTDMNASLASVVVIDRAEIERSQAKDVAELLQFHTGFDVARSGGPGQTTSIFTRGTESNHTLVLVDGVKINPATIALPGIQNIDPAVIERIEIVKGPRSTLYGSDAVGGVINIITKKANTPFASSVQASGGANNTRALAASVSGQNRINEIRGALTLSGSETDGIPAVKASEVDRGYDNKTVQASFGHDVGEHAFDVVLYRSAGNTEYFEGFAADPLVSQDYAMGSGALKWRHPVRENWEAVLEYAHAEDQIWQQYSNYLGEHDYAVTRRDTWDWQHILDVDKSHTVMAGITSSEDNANALSFGTGFQEHSRSTAVYLQDQRLFDGHQVVIGARHTRQDSFGSHVTGEMSYGVTTRAFGRIFASAATAFRAPDFTDRFGYGGNPDLDPERATSFELGTLYDLPVGALQASMFYSRIDDLINSVSLDDNGTPGVTWDDIYGNVNVDRARIQGIELGYDVTFGSWVGHAGAVLQDPRDMGKDEVLSRRARRSATLKGSYHFGKASLGSECALVGERDDSPYDDVVMGGYTVCNALADAKWGKGLTVGLKIENLFDKDYEQAAGYRTPRRGVFATVSYDISR